MINEELYRQLHERAKRVDREIHDMIRLALDADDHRIGNLLSHAHNSTHDVRDLALFTLNHSDEDD